MKRLVLALLFALFTLPAFAQAATLTVKWTDPTPASTAYVPVYSAEYRVNAGTATPINGLTTPQLTQTITAVLGNTVEVRYRASNKVIATSVIDGPWTAWYPATSAVIPGTQSAPTVLFFSF